MILEIFHNFIHNNKHIHIYAKKKEILKEGGNPAECNYLGQKAKLKS